MGKLLSGRYGSESEAESMQITLRECNQKLGMKPTDFVSEGKPKFFEKAFGASGKYLIFLMDTRDVQDNPIWKFGYYLLPLEAKDILVALEKHKGGSVHAGQALPIQWEVEPEAAPDIVEKALKWGR